MIITNSRWSIQRLASWATKRGWRYQIDDNGDDFDEDYNCDNENKHINNADRNKKQDTASFTKGFLDRMSGPLVQVNTIETLIPYISKI